MSKIETAALRSLTEAINERIAEEYDLHGFATRAPVLKPAVVRVVREVILERVESERGEAVHEQERDPGRRINEAIEPVGRDGAQSAVIQPLPPPVPSDLTFRPNRSISVASTVTVERDTAHENRHGLVGAPAVPSNVASDAGEGGRYDASPTAISPEPEPSRTHEAVTGVDAGLGKSETVAAVVSPAPPEPASAKEAATTPDKVDEATATLSLRPPLPAVQRVPVTIIDVAPVVPQPAPPSHIQQKAAERLALRERLFAFLRKIAIDQVMPSIAEYNERRTAGVTEEHALPSAGEIMNSLGYSSWQDVAHDAKLDWVGRGRQERRLNPVGRVPR